MNEKQINKWLRKRFSPVGWTLVGYYVLMNILVSMAMLRRPSRLVRSAKRPAC